MSRQENTPDAKRRRTDRPTNSDANHEATSPREEDSPRIETPAGSDRGSIDALNELSEDSFMLKPPTSASWNNWQGAESSETLHSMLLPSDPKSKGKAQAMDIPRQEPIVAFPLNYVFPPPVNAAGNSNANSGNIAIDPALSSVRSSADQKPNNISDQNSPQIPPELEITEDTLQSASDQSSAALRAALEQARGEGAIMDMDMTGEESGEQGSSGQGNGLLAPPDDDTPKKDQPFSRSPELKITHKLAERKRRREMKDMFDELGEMVPQERGTKSSKWEILSRAIDHVKNLKQASTDLAREVEELKKELEAAKAAGYKTPSIFDRYMSHYAADGTLAVQPGTEGAVDGSGAGTQSDKKLADAGANTAKTH